MSETIPAATSPAISEPRRWTKTGIRVMVTVLLLVLLFWQVRWQDVWSAFHGLNPYYLALSTVLIIPTLYTQYLKWEILAAEAGPRVTRAEINRGFWVGFTLGLATPGRIGQYGRALALKNCSLARAAGVTFIERSYSGIVVNALGLASLVVLPKLGWIPPYPAPGLLVDLLLLAIAVGLLALGVFPRVLTPWVFAVTRRLPFAEKVTRAASTIEVVTPKRGLTLMALSVLSLSSALLQFVVLLRALDAPVPVAGGMLAGLLTFFIKGSIPIGVGSLGVGEWTAVLCLSGLGVASADAIAASLLLFTMNVFLPGLIGLPHVTSLRSLNLSAATNEGVS